MLTFANDFSFITFNAVICPSKRAKGETEMNAIVEKDVQQIAVEFLKTRKNTEKIDISSIEQRGSLWIIRGTCPIDLEGHPWAEKFEVIIDNKGNIKSTEFSLL